MIDAALEPLHRRHRGDCLQTGQRPTFEFLAHEASQHLDQAFGCLERHVAHEAVAHHDVGCALEDVVALDIAVEVQRTRAQQFARLLDHVVALDDLFADVQQADCRAFLLVDRRHQRRSQDGELQQVVRAAVDVGAEIEHGRHAALLVRNHARDGWTVDAIERLEDETCNRHQGAGVAGTDTHVRASFLDQVDREPHRGIALAAQRQSHWVVHLDDLVRMNDLDRRRDGAG
jgi:hypothetical protein